MMPSPEFILESDSGFLDIDLTVKMKAEKHRQQSDRLCDKDKMARV